MINKEKGRLGEYRAISYLERKNYTILESNYHFKKSEIDIIAKDNSCETLCFIEVKLRSNYKFGYPENQIKTNQILSIKRAADYYLETLKHLPLSIRFDVIAIQYNQIQNSFKIHHIQDAFS